MLRLSSILALIFILASCAVISFEELEPKLCIAESSDWFNGEFFEIKFSEDMDHNNVENKLKLYKNGGIIESEIFWNGRVCRIREQGGFKKGVKYKVSVEGSLLTDDGRSYDEYISREFFYGEESEIFKMSWFFKDEESAEEKINGPLILEFNKPLDTAVFEREFSISPYVELKKIYSPDKKTVEIRPAKGWTVNTDYTWNADNVISFDGYCLYKKYSGTFFPVEKEEAPKLLCVCPALLPASFDGENAVLLKDALLDEMLERQPVAFLFDCPMDFESIQKNITFTDAVRGYWLKKNSECYIFCPSENYAVSGEYRITVSADVTDIFGIKMKESKNIDFCLKSKFLEADFYWEGEKLLDGQLNEITLSNYSPFFLTVVFSERLDEKSLQDIHKKISVTAVSPMSSSIPFVEEVRIDGDRKIEMQWNNFSRSSLEAECIYKITVDGGSNSVSGVFGNKVKEEICRYIMVK